MTQADFERDFYSRTLAYLPEFIADPRAVVVVLGESAHTPTGHALVAALANQLARAHKRLLFVGDLNRELLCRNPFGAATLHEATVGLAVAINPFIDATAAANTPAEADVLLSIGIGCTADLRVGASGWCALFGDEATIDDVPTSLLGAAYASVLAAGVAFHRQVGRLELPNGSYSLWEYGASSTAQGPTCIGPIEVGRVLQAGAGAVACALDYWLAMVGLDGGWTIIDGDHVDVTNLGRQMLFVAGDAGFPDGAPAEKASVVAAALGPAAQPVTKWLHEAPEIRDSRYDLILPLANEHGARGMLQARPEPLLLHATTTPNWTATVHRHIASRDGCITCRLPVEPEPTFSCSTGKVGKTQRADASLPFLSAAAGVLLLAEIVRLQLGRLAERQHNYGVLDLAEPNARVCAYDWPCSDGCRNVPPSSVRRALAGTTRWAALDPAG